VIVVLRAEAEEDLEEARDWYEDQRPGLGVEFLAEVDAAIYRLADAPQRFPEVHGSLRRGLLRRFPYAIYFLAEADRIVIVAILHQRRNPAAWNQRPRS
jgi:plasmid stabilization system protein ParE